MIGSLGRRGLGLQLLYATLGARAARSELLQRSRIWYCPAALGADRKLRSDYMSALRDDGNWAVIAPRVGILKFFIESITPGPGHLTDSDLRELVAVCKRHNFAAAFEVGGVRMSAAKHGPGSGRYQAIRECTVLRRWSASGGQIDYITTDNAVMNTIALVYQHKPPPLGPNYKPSMAEIVAEAAAAMSVFSGEFPGAKIGSTESLGYFSLGNGLGKRMHNLDPAFVPDIPLEHFLRDWLTALSGVGVILDHFHIDFGYEAVLADGKCRTLEFERVACANKLFHSYGVRTGLMVGAFDRYSLARSMPPNEQAGDESAVTNTVRYFDAFLRSGIPVDEILFDRWEPYPARTGPAGNPLSDMGLTQELLLRSKAYGR